MYVVIKIYIILQLTVCVLEYFCSYSLSRKIKILLCIHILYIYIKWEDEFLEYINLLRVGKLKKILHQIGPCSRLFSPTYFLEGEEISEICNNNL